MARTSGRVRRALLGNPGIGACAAKHSREFRQATGFAKIISEAAGLTTRARAQVRARQIRRSVLVPRMNPACRHEGLPPVRTRQGRMRVRWHARHARELISPSDAPMSGHRRGWLASS